MIKGPQPMDSRDEGTKSAWRTRSGPRRLEASMHNEIKEQKLLIAIVELRRVVTGREINGKRNEMTKYRVVEGHKTVKGTQLS